MGRPREFEEDEALAQIMDVFWAKGFEGTAMSDLMSATGLQKGSLYAAFGDKRAVYLRALAHYDQTVIEGAVDLLSGADAPERRIGDFLQSAIDPVATRNDRRGCFLCNASADQAIVDGETEQSVKMSLGRLSRALKQALSEIPLGDGLCDPEAQHLLSVYVGLRVLAKAGYAVHALRDARSRALLGLSSRERSATIS